MALTTKKRGVLRPLGLERQPTTSAFPWQLNEALHTDDSNEPSSCCWNSWFAVAGKSSPRKTKSVKALHPTFPGNWPEAVPSERRWVSLTCERSGPCPARVFF